VATLRRLRGHNRSPRSLCARAHSTRRKIPRHFHCHPRDTTRPAVWGRLRESFSMLLEASPTTVIFKINVLPSHHATLFANLQQIVERAALPTHSSPAPAAPSISLCSPPPQMKTPRASLAIHRSHFRFDLRFGWPCFASLCSARQQKEHQCLGFARLRSRLMRSSQIHIRPTKHLRPPAASPEESRKLAGGLRHLPLRSKIGA